MSTVERKDAHRPSAIKPEEYRYVACDYYGGSDADLGMAMHLKHQRELLRLDMERTGGKRSTHEHGGTCHVCGACAMYVAIWHHLPTNTYIVTGEDCAAKMDTLDGSTFRYIRDEVKRGREAKAGKTKAKILLADAGVERAWDLYLLSPHLNDGDFGPLKELGLGDVPWCYSTLRDIVDKLVRYGSISEKQMNLVKRLAVECDNFEATQAARKAAKAKEMANAEPCPEGRHTVRGVVISTKYDDRWDTYKMVLKDDRGFRVWGTVPQAFGGVERGDRVELTATITKSDDDDHFGFYKRPAKATHTPAVSAEEKTAQNDEINW